MANQTKIQELVHKLEEGGWVKRVKFAVILSAVIFNINLWFFRDAGFRGLSHEKAIEQAQIAREIARGNGFTTKMIRPAALWLFEKNMGKFPVAKQPDIYHAPLNPYINAGVIKTADALNDLFRGWQKKSDIFSWFIYEKVMSPKELIYVYDKFIAGVQVLFYLLAVLINYYSARRLFDDRLAAFAGCMMLICQRFWEYAMSGLPQMLMLFLFSAAAHTLIRAIEAKYLAKSAMGWLSATAALFGLLALAHGITIWMFVGALIFVLLLFRPFGRDAAIMAVIFMAIYTPWLVRNQQVCGTPVGLGWYSGLYEIRGTESKIMRSLDVSLEGVSPRTFRSKVQRGVIEQMRVLYDFLGQSLMAPIFFVSLLHLFKRPETSNFRWAIFAMWLCAVFGMAVFGMPEGGLRANDLHVLFIPLMICYGLAFVLVMWTRLEINIKLIRLGFLSLLFFLSSMPFINDALQMMAGPQSRIQWPPYVPPYIAIMGPWTTEKEVITSDMPWAVAWYADRKSLWLPMSIQDFITLNDYKQLNGDIVGLYLTPVTGNKAFLADIVKGEYSEWAPFILRNVTAREFPLKVSTVMPIDNECIFYADRDRWTNRED
jgi:Dolichyl-phosphate-mannose-protein mannosyltransferase